MCASGRGRDASFSCIGLATSLRFLKRRVGGVEQSVSSSAWVHDWGKANDHFQDLLSNRLKEQGIRHETLSMVLLSLLSPWVFHKSCNLPQWAVKGVFFSVGLHHLKCQSLKKRSKERTKVSVFAGHKDFHEIMTMGSERFGLAPPPKVEDISYSLVRGELTKILETLESELEDLRFSDRERMLMACLKVGLMNADLAGSALPRNTERPEDWLHRKLNIRLSRKKLEKIVEEKLSGHPLREFQKDVACANTKTVLAEAGCGSGKTIAAYLWAAGYADELRLFFCYPTTGTASEGFSGYLHDPDFEAILVHSRSDVDYRLLENMPARGSEERELIESRLEAMETWPIPAVVCTAHTVFGLFETERRGILCMAFSYQSRLCLRRNSCIQRKALFLPFDFSQDVPQFSCSSDDGYSSCGATNGHRGGV